MKATGERWERRRWREERPERVAAVGVQRSRTVGKAHTGHRNRGAMGAPPVAGGDADCHVAALLAMTTRCGAAVKYRKRRKIYKNPRGQPLFYNIYIQGTIRKSDHEYLHMVQR